MFCDFSANETAAPVPFGVRIRAVEDYSVFRRLPHPYFGRITTPIRQFELARITHLAGCRTRRVWEFFAWSGGAPVGAATVSLGSCVAGIFDVGVLPNYRGRGIGTALVGHLCAFARQRGMAGAALIASGMGVGVYRRAGFQEVCKMSYWYSSLDKNRSRHASRSGR